MARIQKGQASMAWSGILGFTALSDKSLSLQNEPIFVNLHPENLILENSIVTF